MFVVKIKYLAELTEIDKYLQAHRDFLDLHYQSGLFLASGPISPRVGGILIALGHDRGHLEKVLKDDPYAKAHVAEYDIIEFSAVKYRNEIEALV